MACQTIGDRQFGIIPSTKVTEIVKAFSNYVPNREPPHAPIHALDKAYAKLRETVPAVENTLHPQIKGGLVVDLHASRVIRPRNGSEKRAREDGSVASTEAAQKKGKSGKVSQTSSAQPTSQSGKATSQSKTQQKRARSSSKGRPGNQKGKTDSKSGTQGEKGKKDNNNPPRGGGRGRRPPRSNVGQGRFYRW